MSTTSTGNIILILGPSGTGKGTVIQFLKKNFPTIVFPASYTTRDTRPDEIAGEVYHFITKKKFEAKVAKGDFLEWAVVHGNHFYGTDKQEILKNLDKNKTIIREVDIQGVNSLKKILPSNKIHTIFLTTDTWNQLENRIKKRANITKEELVSRRKSYEEEIKYIEQMDHVLYSEDGNIEKTNQEAFNIVTNILNQNQ